MFALSREHDSFAKTLHCMNIPRFYSWTNKRWETRRIGKRGEQFSRTFEAIVLGQVYAISPQSGDLYCSFVT